MFPAELQGLKGWTICSIETTLLKNLCTNLFDIIVALDDNGEKRTAKIEFRKEAILKAPIGF